MLRSRPEPLLYRSTNGSGNYAFQRDSDRRLPLEEAIGPGRLRVKEVKRDRVEWHLRSAHSRATSGVGQPLVDMRVRPIIWPPCKIEVANTLPKVIVRAGPIDPRSIRRLVPD
jgi:hypothetical protein